MDKKIESIWSELSTNLKHFILTKVKDEQTVDDILQEVFLKIHANLGSLQDDSKLTSWVYQITRNAIVDHYRSQHISEPLDEELAVSDEMDDEVRTALTHSLQEMVAALPEEYREALMLDAFEGLDQAKIGARLGISVSGAKSRVQRARAKLRAMLYDCCHFEFDRRGGVINYVPREQCCAQCCGTSNVTLLPV
jgi:RNA polymerase sigma-70 factor, ECF subfamily